MKLLGNGYFSIEFTADQLLKGLRNTEDLPRNSPTLTSCSGLVGQHGVLKTLPDLEIPDLFNTALIVKDDFPFPQVFTLERHIIVCNRNSILENAQGKLIHKFTIDPEIYGVGSMWEVASFFDFIYLTNHAVALTRNSDNGIYTISETLPVAKTLCNYNGQVFAGNVTNM